MDIYTQLRKFSGQLLAAALILGLAAVGIWQITQPADAAFYNPSGQSGNWDYRKEITIDSAQVDSSLTDFPIYIDLGDLGSDFFSNVSADGGDIRITTANGETELAREIVSIDTGANTGELHFKADSLSALSDTGFYIYYGNSQASDYAESDTYGAQNVWTNGYEGVWHMEVGNIVDSTSNNNNGTNNGSTAIGGQLSGGARDFANANITVPDSASLSDDTRSSLTASMWINSDDILDGSSSVRSLEQNNQYFFIEGFPGGHDIIIKPNNESPGGSDTLPANEWHMLHGTFDGANTTLKGYRDGALGSTNTAAASQIDAGGGLGLYIGSDDGGPGASSLDGSIDELRIASNVRSADWIATEHSNQKTPAIFYTVGPQESDTTAPTVTTQAASDVTTSSATGNGNLTDTGGENADERGFVWSTTSQTDPGNTVPGSSSYANSVSETGSFGTGTFTGSLSGLSADTTYYYRSYAHNSQGYSYGGEESFTTSAASGGGGTIQINSGEIRGGVEFR